MITSINIERATKKANFMFQQIDDPLRDRDWLELNRPTITDVAVFPYVALAPEGMISLQPYANVLAWIERLRRLPGFVGMPGVVAPRAAA